MIKGTEELKAEVEEVKKKKVDNSPESPDLNPGPA